LPRARHEPPLRQRDQHHPRLHAGLPLPEALGSDGAEVPAADREADRARDRALQGARGPRREDDGVAAIFWPGRLLTAKLRPLDAAALVKLAVTTAIAGAFLYGDFALFRRLFRAIAEVEQSTPFFALGLLRNLLALVFLVAVVILFSSAMTAAIGAFFTDLDLEIYHAAPRAKARIVAARWAKTLAESATVVYLFLIPMFVAFARQYPVPRSFFPLVLANLAMLLAIPVTLGALLILTLVRWFP